LFYMCPMPKKVGDYERVINNWNLLDQTVLDACSVDVFKNSLHIFRNTRMDLFKD